MFLAAEVEDALEVLVALRLQLPAGTFLELGDESVKNFDVVAVAVAVDDEEVLGVGLLQGKINLLALVIDIQRKKTRANLRGSEHEDDPVRNVGSP